MNAEYLLDAIGLLDDDLIREAEEYRRPKAKHSYGVWLGWAASFAVVIALGYWVTHLPMGGGNSMAPSTPSGAPAASTPAASAPAENGFPGGGEATGDAAPEDNENFAAGGGSAAEPANPSVEAPVQGDWLFAIRVDGTVYWATEESVSLEPDSSELRYTTSFLNGTELEEDGQANFEPVGTAYVKLDNGTVAVFQEDTGFWRVYDPVPPWEQ